MSTTTQKSSSLDDDSRDKSEAFESPESPDPDAADDDDALERTDARPDDRTLPPGADPSIDWGLTSHLNADGTPKIVERWFDVPPELAGLRLDHFVKTQIVRLSRTRIQQIIETQLFRESIPRSGASPDLSSPGPGRLKPATTVMAGDRFVIRRPAPPEPPCPLTLTVVHEDARMVVVDKPAGLPVHSSAKFYFNTLTRVLAERFPGEPEIQICHRLDRETSGCLVVARDRAAAASLKLSFEHKRATKTYLAVVHGEPPWDDELALDIPLRLSTREDPTRVPGVRMMPGPGGLRSITKVVVLRRGTLPDGSPSAIVRCTLVTGRQHQIRAHLAATGFHIVGDKLYGLGDDAFVEFCDHGLSPDLMARLFVWRHALHAHSITIPHPDGHAVTATAPLPRELDALVA